MASRITLPKLLPHYSLFPCPFDSFNIDTAFDTLLSPIFDFAITFKPNRIECLLTVLVVLPAFDVRAIDAKANFKSESRGCVEESSVPPPTRGG